MPLLAITTIRALAVIISLWIVSPANTFVVQLQTPMLRKPLLSSPSIFKSPTTPLHLSSNIGNDNGILNIDDGGENEDEEDEFPSDTAMAKTTPPPSPSPSPSQQSKSQQQGGSQQAPLTPTPPDDASAFGDTIPKLNTVHLIGRIGQTPNPRYFDDGKGD